jgi:hypothetical protein
MPPNRTLLPVAPTQSRHAAEDRWIWQSRLLRIKWQDWNNVAPSGSIPIHQHNTSNPRLPTFEHDQITVSSRFEHLV